jgi:ADP-ribose pyrophosphatase YjhB (NUDIX family)
MQYTGQTRILVAVDCIIFGFDGYNLKLLLIHRGFEPMKDKWSLIGGFIHTAETPEGAADRVLEQYTGLKDVYMDQFHVFGKPDRDPVERTLSIAYFALIDIHQYEKQISDQYHAEWFLLSESLPNANCVTKQPCTRFYFSCYQLNLLFPNYRHYTRAFTIQNLTIVILVVNYCQPVY